MVALSFNAASAFFGRLGKFHKALFALQPKSGDYASAGSDTDVNPTTGVTTAYAEAVVLVDPATGLAYSGGARGNTKTNITTATTTVVPGTAGAAANTLWSLAVNTLVAGATIKLYDSNSGATGLFATITLPSTITGDSPFVLNLGVPLTNGLVVVTSAATDLTVVTS